MTLQEADLYAPVCALLQEAGYTVRAEVKDCDIAAIRDDTLVIVELKRAFSLKLVYQIIQRQQTAEYVFAAIPRPKEQKGRAYRDMLQLMKRLGAGLITVALDSPLQTAEVVLSPLDSPIFQKNKKARARICKEARDRLLDLNEGGITRRKIMTAYKEKSIALCCLLEKTGEISLAELRKMGVEEDRLRLLSSNYNHWYERAAKGVYRLSAAGKEAMEDVYYEKVTAYYRAYYADREGSEKT